MDVGLGADPAAIAMRMRAQQQSEGMPQPPMPAPSMAQPQQGLGLMSPSLGNASADAWLQLLAQEPTLLQYLARLR